jgi:Rad3-related DNA helicase
MYSMGDTYSVSVRSLCEFTAKRGDLGGGLMPGSSAQAGIAGHQRVGARRGPGYEREVTLRARYQALQVRGRADGYDPGRNLLEEYKTHRGDLGRMARNVRELHWAQLKIYGAMLCAERALAAVELGLVYFDLQSETETSFRERFSAEPLQREFEAHCGRFLAWALGELAHRDKRDRYLAALRFPHAGLRTGQRQMAEAVYRAARAGRTVMIQAPTGIGKTLGTLFPLLKAAPRQKLDKLFFLVAKTSGRGLALHALGQLAAGAAAPLRVLELVAKDAACEYPGRACEAQSCPLARGFYDRLPAARERALDAAWLDRDALRRAALAHEVCPYHLAQELIRWCDVIVGDYNYFFDASAILHALTLEHQWRVGLLVDEAHNLLARARDMYTASLDPLLMQAALRVAPTGLHRRLAALQRGWRAIHPAQDADYAVLPAIPPGLLRELERATAALADELAQGPAPLDEALLRFYFHALHFSRRAQAFGSHSLFDVTRLGADSVLCVRCVNPGTFLNPRFAAGVTAVLFSATLAPAQFYRTLLGLPPGTPWINIPSPFDQRQLEVRIESRISTRFHDRGRSLSPIVDLMLRQYRSRPGNYLAFFSSFSYLDAVCGLFRERGADVPVWAQTRGMPAVAREGFLARFTERGCGIGFAVLGGAFAEGIDLPGERLTGAFIATLGLPQVNGINTEIERRMQAMYGSGYEYTYLYPGLQKVIQAAGRVIRTPSDRGTVVLIDDRYRGAQVRDLLPDWWRVE